MAQEDNWRIDHTGIGVADVHKSARFYDAALGALNLHPIVRLTKTCGITASADDPELGGVGYGADYPVFWIDVFHPHGVKQHTAFRACERSEVEAFHKAALPRAARTTARLAFAPAATRRVISPLS